MIKLKAKLIGEKDLLNMLDINKHRLLVRGATNTAGAKAFSATKRAVKKRYNITVNMGQMPFTKQKATTTDMTFKIITGTRMQNIGVMFKGAKQTASGVQVQIKKGQKKIIKGSFIARPTGKSYTDRGQKKQVTTDKQLILKRKTDKAYLTEGAGDSAPRGMGWATVLLNKAIKQETSKVFQEEFQKNFYKRLEKLANKNIMVVGD